MKMSNNHYVIVLKKDLDNKIFNKEKVESFLHNLQSDILRLIPTRYTPKVIEPLLTAYNQPIVKENGFYKIAIAELFKVLAKAFESQIMKKFSEMLIAVNKYQPSKYKEILYILQDFKEYDDIYWVIGGYPYTNFSIVPELVELIQANIDTLYITNIYYYDTY